MSYYRHEQGRAEMILCAAFFIGEKDAREVDRNNSIWYPPNRKLLIVSYSVLHRFKAKRRGVMFKPNSIRCTERRGNFKYAVGGHVTCGDQQLPIALSITKNRHCSDVRISLLCPARSERKMLRKLALFANVRRALVWSTRMQKRVGQPITKIGIMFPMDERHRTFRDYLSIAEHAISGVDQSINP